MESIHSLIWAVGYSDDEADDSTAHINIVADDLESAVAVIRTENPQWVIQDVSMRGPCWNPAKRK